MDGHAPPLNERWGSGNSSGGLVRGGPLPRPLSYGVCAVRARVAVDASTALADGSVGLVSGHGALPAGSRRRPARRTSGRTSCSRSRWCNLCAPPARLVHQTREPVGGLRAVARAAVLRHARVYEGVGWHLCGLGGGGHAAALLTSWPRPQRQRYLSTFRLEPPIVRTSSSRGAPGRWCCRSSCTSASSRLPAGP
jgi:hypothetical protein